MTVSHIDLRDQRPVLSAGAVICHSCSQLVPMHEILDGWQEERGLEDCPRCFGPVLAPVVTA